MKQWNVIIFNFSKLVLKIYYLNCLSSLISSPNYIRLSPAQEHLIYRSLL